MFIFLFATHTNSQNDDECYLPSIPPPSNGSSPIYSASIDPAYLETFEPVVFNIFFWGIRNDSGTSTPTVTKETALQAVADLNIAFNPFNIFFKYTGFDNSSFTSSASNYDSWLHLIRDEAVLRGFVSSNAIDVYVPKWFKSGGGQAPGVGGGLLYCGVRQSSLEIARGASLAHEIGHNLGIAHMEIGYQNYNPNNPPTNPHCERVTRDPNDPLFNADTHGDHIVDTSAVPKFYNPEEHTLDIDLSDCSYIGVQRNCYGEDYDIRPEDIKNFMSNGRQESYSHIGCKDRFSIGQGIRMHETIDYYKNTAYVEEITTFEALYEPYEGAYYLSGNTQPPSPLFQPGFDYKFIHCSGDYPQPAPYNDTFSFNAGMELARYYPDIDVNDFNTITHPNKSALIIEQVDQAQGFSKPQKCYNNSNGIARRGAVVRFNDNVFNHNISTTLVDSLTINDQTLINTLQSGLYKIQKEYNDGSVEETIIYKEQ